MNKTDAIILAGGKGTRLRSVLMNTPKPLAPINGKPFLDILLEQLDESGSIRRVVLSVGYLADMIIDRYSGKTDYGFNIVFSVEDKLLDTGGAIKKAISFTETENVLAMNGDSYTEISYIDLLRQHENSEIDMTIVLRHVDNATRYGAVTLGSDMRILDFKEKKQISEGGYISAGVYLFKRGMFDDVPVNKPVSIERDLFPVFLNKGIRGYVSSGKFIDIGVPESYEFAKKYLKEIC